MTRPDSAGVHAGEQGLTLLALDHAGHVSVGRGSYGPLAVVAVPRPAARR